MWTDSRGLCSLMRGRRLSRPGGDGHDRLVQDGLRNRGRLTGLQRVQTPLSEEGAQVKVLAEELALDLLDVNPLVDQAFDTEARRRIGAHGEKPNQMAVAHDETPVERVRAVREHLVLWIIPL